MSNNARLLISNQGGPPVTEQDWDAETREEHVNVPMLESKYTVPIFWLTLFGPDDIETYLDPDDGMNVQYLTAPLPEARGRFAQRLPALRKVFKNIDSFVPPWQAVLGGIDKDFIKVDLFQVLELSRDGSDLLAPALRFLEEPTEETTLAFMRLTDFPDVFDQETGSLIQRELESGRTTEHFLLGFDPWQ